MTAGGKGRSSGGRIMKTGGRSKPRERSEMAGRRSRGAGEMFFGSDYFRLPRITWDFGSGRFFDPRKAVERRGKARKGAECEKPPHCLGFPARQVDDGQKDGGKKSKLEIGRDGSR